MYTKLTGFCQALYALADKYNGDRDRQLGTEVLSVSKKTNQCALRLSAELLELGKRMADARRAASLSDYLRGLILLDAAHRSPTRLAGIEIPGWVTRDRRFVKLLSPRGEPHGQKAS